MTKEELTLRLGEIDIEKLRLDTLRNQTIVKLNEIFQKELDEAKSNTDQKPN